MNAPKPTLTELERHLRRALAGEVAFDAATRVVMPVNERDVLATLEIAGQAGVAIVPRGSGLSTGGEALPRRPGEALVVDAGRHLRAIVDFDPQARRVVVQPGVTLAQVNAVAAAHGLWLALEGPGEAQATIGGLVATDAIGACTIGAGRIGRHLDWVDAVLDDGTRQRFGAFGVDRGVSLASGRVGALVSALFERAGREAEALRARRPQATGAVGGYRLDALSGTPTPNLAHLLAGSRGSLCWFERIALILAPLPAHHRMLALPFASPRAAMRAMAALAQLGPGAVFLREDGSVLVEFRSDSPAMLARLVDSARSLAGVIAAPSAHSPSRWSAVTLAPLSGLPDNSGEPSPQTGSISLETWSLPLDRLDRYAAQVDDACAAAGMLTWWSGALGSGAPSVRAALGRGGAAPAGLSDRCASLGARVAAIAVNLGGAPVSEHGDNRVRAEAIRRVHGPSLQAAFGEVKRLFDPGNRFNPGKVIGPSGCTAA